MTTVVSCDHCSAERLVPSNRSRARMLEQFSHARELARAAERLLGYGATVGLYDSTGRPHVEPLVACNLERYLELWRAVNAWRAIEPRGDDLVGPVAPPAEIRVPPLEEETADA